MLSFIDDLVKEDGHSIEKTFDNNQRDVLTANICYHVFWSHSMSSNGIYKSTIIDLNQAQMYQGYVYGEKKMIAFPEIPSISAHIEGDKVYFQKIQGQAKTI